MDVSMLDFIGIGCAGRTDDIVTISRVFDADVAILEYLAEARHPFRFGSGAVCKIPILRHIALSCSS
jgi:hypothetical protein